MHYFILDTVRNNNSSIADLLTIIRKVFQVFSNTLYIANYILYFAAAAILFRNLILKLHRI